jgi:predicted glutamine amidotransferase
MCRLLGVVSKEPQSIVQTADDALEPFALMSDVHKDGWGIAARTSSPGATVPAGTGGTERALRSGGHRRPDPTLEIVRDTDIAWQSSLFRDTARDTITDQAILHLRRASPGLEVKLSNTHPFADGPVAFAHNGWFVVEPVVRDYVAAHHGRTPQGGTDSEVYFGLITAFARTMPWHEAIRAASDFLWESSNTLPEALNCLLMTPDALYAFSRHDPAQLRTGHAPDNYVLQARRTEDAVVISSSGYELDDATRLDEGVVVEVRRDSLEVLLHDETATRRVA